MILGRVAGSVLGVAAGPFGVAFGFLSGFFVDRVVEQVRLREHVRRLLGPGTAKAERPKRSSAEGHDRSLIRLIGLGVAVAVSDGFATDAETGAIVAFVRERCGLSASRAAQLRHVLEEAIVLGSRIEVSRAAAELDRETLQLSNDALLEYLLRIARSRDGEISDRRRRVLRQVCAAAGLPVPAPARERLDRHACAILGISPDADLRQVRKVYRRLVQQFHPDAAGLLSEEQRRQSSEAFIRINRAYRTVATQLQGHEREPDSSP